MSKWVKATRFVVSAEEAVNLESLLKKKAKKQLMDNRLMERTLLAVPATEAGRYSGKEGDPKSPRLEGDWIRVRQGEVDWEGGSTASLTYKRIGKVVDDPAEVVISTEVADYKACVALLRRIGLEIVSVQHNRRSAYALEYDDTGYLVSIDWWPGLDDIRFVAVKPVSSVDADTLREFCQDRLQISSDEPYSGGVDGVYEKRLRIRISDCKRVTFRCPPKPEA